eukprot:TRINITY_DN11638_c0_g1_i1.p1 TRINITY_DN11638_c0_g1~~TRINITY_DN11638_c0_g1_i1.p1  ORF type:complete len:980 (-),score=335.16 TRINITY_DN11638_c0_g1_i1:476-3415(-)
MGIEEGEFVDGSVKSERNRTKEKGGGEKKRSERDRVKDPKGNDRRKVDRYEEEEFDEDRERTRDGGMRVEREKGHERSKTREKDEDSERQKHREKRSDREKEKESERGKEKVKEKEKEKDRVREKDGGKEEEKEKERERRKYKEIEMSREKHREQDDDGDIDLKSSKEKSRRHGRGEGSVVLAGTRESEKSRLPPPSPPPAPPSPPPPPPSVPATPAIHGDTTSLAEKVNSMREKRLTEKKATLPSHPPLATTANDDMASWVARQRVIHEKKKKDEERAKAAQVAARLAEQDDMTEDVEEDWRGKRGSTYGSKELAGLKVRHGLDKVLEGGAVVLTLKDSSILDGGDVNEAMDELENIEIAQQIAREKAYKESKKTTGAIDEDKFQNDINVKPKGILAKYDDDMEDEGVTLDASGGIGEQSLNRLDEVRKRLLGLNSSVQSQSLSGPSTGPASDYYTQEELALRKPKKKKKIRKAKSSALDYDALEEEANAAGLGGAQSLGGEDRGSRRTARITEAAGKKEEDTKAAYERAYQRAVDSSRVFREDNEGKRNGSEGAGGGRDGEEAAAGGQSQGTFSGAVKMEVEDEERRNVKEENDARIEAEEEEDDELELTLMRTRLRALRNKASESGEAEALVRTIRSAVKKEEEEENGDAEVLPEAPGEEAENDGKLVFTETAEFCRNLQLDEAITKRGAGKDVFAEEDEEMAAAPGTVDGAHKAGDDVANRGWTVVKGEELPGDDDYKTGRGKGGDDEDDEEDEKEVLAERSVGTGLAGALSLLRDRGALAKDPEWGGRNMDKKKSKLVGITDSVAPPGQREIRIDRRDEFGRELTPKEAFRQLSHKFHGKGPGKMKQEKRIKQYMEELELKKMASGDTPNMSLGKMLDVQAQTSAPYVVLSGQIKPGQSSDPRSTFGVEKEPAAGAHVGSLTPMLGDRNSVGSLTPMLGDKKVEHFLGLSSKRKAEGEAGDGGMRPPPDRKPRH